MDQDFNSSKGNSYYPEWACVNGFGDGCGLVSATAGDDETLCDPANDSYFSFENAYGFGMGKVLLNKDYYASGSGRPDPYGTGLRGEYAH